MSLTNVVNEVAYLPTSRSYPPDVNILSVQVNRSYIDISSAVNARTIGLFPTQRPAIGGESWFLTGKRQQNLRQVYSFDDTNLVFPHGILFDSLTNFVRIWGTFFDGTNWQSLPYVDVVNANNQISLYVDNAQINVVKGAGAPPTINNGLVILEWLSQV